MFVSDNKTFDKTTIDYLENFFIKAFNNSTYILENSVITGKTTQTNYFEESRYINAAKHIEFLLLSNGIKIDSVVENLETNENSTYFQDKQGKAKLCIIDGKYILKKGSKLKTLEHLNSLISTKNKSSTNNSIKLRIKTIKQLIDNDNVYREGENLITKVDITYTSPSQAGGLVCGSNVNGWDFWLGLNELREKEYSN